MSRKIEKIKGFAMSELLAVCVVVLLIFAILFANYLPLLAEYEVRISYNNVTSQYAAHYIRAIYKEIIEGETDTINLINQALESNGYLTIYKEGATTQEIENHVNKAYISNQTTANRIKSELEKLISEYGIEEMVISTYKTEGLKEKYTAQSGGMKKYINYLPKYDKSIYTGEKIEGYDEEKTKQLYRLTLKTKEFGYATTPILTDMITPHECFILKPNKPNDADYYTITGYKYDGDKCKGVITLQAGEEVTDGNNGKAIIKHIGENAFSPTKNELYKTKYTQIGEITEIYLSTDIETIGAHAFDGLTNLQKYKIPGSENKTTIGDYAFANTGITGFDADTNSEVNGVISIGEYAFAYNNNLTTVNVKSGVTYGTETFSNNGKLTTINFEQVQGGTIKLSEAIFLNSGNDGDGISLNIPNNISGQSIPLRAFNKTNIKSLVIAEEITNIGKYAFSQNKTYYDDKGVLRSSDSEEEIGKGNISELTIPSSVETIGESAFRLLPIGTIDFTSATNLVTIGNYSFELKDTQTKVGEDSENILIIPGNVKNIGALAFLYRGLPGVDFSKLGANEINIYTGAFAHNKIVELKLPQATHFYMNKTLTAGGVHGIFENNPNLSIERWPEKMNTTLYKGTGFGNILSSEAQPGMIPPKCFSKIKGNETLIIPSYVKAIGQQAFEDVSGVREIKFECDNTTSENLTIGNYAFKNFNAKDPKLETITLPSNTTSVGKEAFYTKRSITINNYSGVIKDVDWCTVLSDKLVPTPTYICEATSTGVNMTDKTGGTTTEKTINHITSGEGGCVQ